MTSPHKLSRHPNQRAHKQNKTRQKFTKMPNMSGWTEETSTEDHVSLRNGVIKPKHLHPKLLSVLKIINNENKTCCKPPKKKTGFSTNSFKPGEPQHSRVEPSSEVIHLSNFYYCTTFSWNGSTNCLLLTASDENYVVDLNFEQLMEKNMKI